MAPARDTSARDHAFLARLADALDDDPDDWVTGRSIGAQLELDDRQALAAVKRLQQGGLVHPAHGYTPSFGEDDSDAPLELTAAGVRESGAWPTPETGLDRMIAALEAIAEHTDDEDTRSRARRVLDGITGGSKHIGLAMATAYATGQIPT